MKISNTKSPATASRITSRRTPSGHPPASNKGRKVTRYPWEEWFTTRVGKELILTRGIDFSCQVHGMVSNLRRMAGTPKWRLRLLLRITGDTVRVTIVGNLPPTPLTHPIGGNASTLLP